MMIYYEYSRSSAPQPDKKDKPVVLQGYVNYRVPKGTPIKLKLSMVPTNGLRLLDRDMDGNLLPAKKGQVITAKTTEDIFVGANKVIPEGTTFFGRVTQIHPQRRVGRPGHLDISLPILSYLVVSNLHLKLKLTISKNRPQKLSSKDLE